MTLDFDVRRTFTARGADPFAVEADLEVPAGETLVVLGPSGSGKSLLLETLGGFHDHEGTVSLSGRRIDGLPPEERGFGFVFQEYALFPHRSVRENVAFGLRYHDGTRRPDELLADLGIAGLADRRPDTLSGGEKQRVALARALAIDPEVLLLDEPLSALDVPTRRALREDMADVLDRVTAVYVTHDRTTARALGDRIAVLEAGAVRQVGTPEAVFEHPASAFVARFTGANCLRTAELPAALVPGDASRVAIRPEHVRVTAAPRGDATGTVERTVREEGAVRIRVRVVETTVDAFVADPPAVGDRVGVVLPADRLVRIPEDGG